MILKKFFVIVSRLKQKINENTYSYILNSQCFRFPQTANMEERHTDNQSRIQ
jgi:hypothetical protein